MKTQCSNKPCKKIREVMLIFHKKPHPGFCDDCKRKSRLISTEKYRRKKGIRKWEDHILHIRTTKPLSKLTQLQVNLIRSVPFVNQVQMAKKFKVSPNTIWRIVHNITWK